MKLKIKKSVLKEAIKNSLLKQDLGLSDMNPEDILKRRVSNAINFVQSGMKDVMRFGIKSPGTIQKFEKRISTLKKITGQGYL